jgi:hypothetical protein
LLALAVVSTTLFAVAPEAEATHPTCTVNDVVELEGEADVGTLIS